MVPVWNIELLGSLQAKSDALTIARFRTRRVGLLLASLALFPNRSHSREELAYLLWPDETEEISRRNLRQALSSLRRHLEPPPLPSGSVLIAKQSSVRLNTKTVSTDVEEFERLLTKAADLQAPEEKMDALEAAIGMYKGSLLPGHYEDWIEAERERLENSYVHGLKLLASLGESLGRLDKAITYLRLAIAHESLDEDLYTSIMRLYLDSGRPASALKQYKELERILRLELRCAPSEKARQLALRARAEGGEVSASKSRVAQDLPSPAPGSLAPSRPLASRHVRLPIKLTRFHGRCAEMKTATALILNQRVRLVSLCGPAGVGKTRLSIEVAKHLADGKEWNVWFVPLANITQASNILDAVADAVKARSDDREPLEQVRSMVSNTRSLLVLDNLEHILDGAAPIVANLLESLESVTILTTSRQALKIEGEHVLDIQPLPVPSTEANALKRLKAGELAAFAEFPSIQLYIDRCQTVHPDYQLTPVNARTISAVCDRLEGLPLALEIAASLSNTFTATQLLQNLESRLEILKNRNRDAEPRHRSLRAAIDYSYELLPSHLQKFFACLSVFRGGFTISAAKAVCMEGDGSKNSTSAERRRSRERCLRAILDLQERSLVHTDDSFESPEARYRVLESFREFGREQLSEEEEEALQNRHADYYFNIAAHKPSSRLGGPGHDSGSLRLERDNLLAAQETYVDRGHLEQAIQLSETALQVRGSLRASEAQAEIVRRIGSDPLAQSVSPKHFVTLKRMMANVRLFAGDYEAAMEQCQMAMDVALRAESEELVARSHKALAVVEGYRGQNERALEHYLAVLGYSESIADLDILESVYIGIGTLRWKLNDLAGAEQAFLQAKEVGARSAESDYWLVRYNLARVLLDMGKLDEAMSYAGQALRLSKHSADEFGISMSLSMMSRYHWLKHNLPDAFSTSLQALRIRQGSGFSYWINNGIQFHGLLLADAGSAEQAAVLLASSKIGLDSSRPTDLREFTAAIEKAKDALAEQAFESAWARGLSMSMDEVVDFALGLAS